eukprot:TRINITY_DN10309_c0_g1_i1.p1 TRINITY_DN10309_c0_g1~~TRINITY_DN10309_c0_g1_i1.p1  ORF type:complete len:916 (+),score=292.94 TRINITY_DN10309_c0_g1_i1:36-2750(+)
MSSVKVAVRVRPFNSREKKKKAKLVVQMKSNTTEVINPETGHKNTFAFDHSHWSFDEREDVPFADQTTVFTDIGQEIVDHAFDGYNSCTFAYGQTGAGKSYSMMGGEDGEQRGVIPRLCEALFERMEQEKSDDRTFNVEVSYLEIYNEKVRDLLNPRSEHNLRVREHPLLGPYVEDLSRLAVTSYQDIQAHLEAGNKARRVASTNMNATSSRSHAIFSLIFQSTSNHGAKIKSEKLSKINLVDLAGSERASSTGATGDRLKEGASINKSLTSLGKVISALAEASQAEASATAAKTTGKKKKGKKKSKSSSNKKVIPYRDSALTWLLRESLGGNSKTTMVAAISPADINFDETLSTLRYANSAKQIVCKAIVNEDPTAKMIRELKEEVSRLQGLVTSGDTAASEDAAADDQPSASELNDQLEASEKLMKELTTSWEDKVKQAEAVKEERTKVLEEVGIRVKEGAAVGMSSPKKRPHLVNMGDPMDEDELLLYYLQEVTTIGTGSDGEECDVTLRGDGIMPEHGLIIEEEGLFWLQVDPDATTIVEGLAVTECRLLSTGAVIQFGSEHTFRFVNPEQARHLKACGLRTRRSAQVSRSESAEDLSALTAERTPVVPISLVERLLIEQPDGMSPSDLVDEILDSLSIGDDDDDDDAIEAALQDMRLALYVFDIVEKRLFTSLKDGTLLLHLAPALDRNPSPVPRKKRQLPSQPSPLGASVAAADGEAPDTGTIDAADTHESSAVADAGPSEIPSNEPSAAPSEDTAQEEQLHNILDRIASMAGKAPAAPSPGSTEDKPANPLDRLTKSQADKLLALHAKDGGKSLLDAGLQGLTAGAGKLWETMEAAANTAYGELDKTPHDDNDDNDDENDEAAVKRKAARAALDRMSAAAGKDSKASGESSDCAVIM